MIAEHIPSPCENAKKKLVHTYTGPLDSDIGDDMLSCDPEVKFGYECFNYITQDILSNNNYLKCFREP